MGEGVRGGGIQALLISDELHVEPMTRWYGELR